MYSGIGEIIKGVIILILGGFGLWVLQRIGIMSPPVSSRERVADLHVTPRVIYEEGWEDFLFAIKIINTSQFMADNIRILVQEIFHARWKDIPCKHGQSLPPRSEEIVVLSPKPFETVLKELGGSYEYYFVFRIEWINQNGSPGCLFHYARAYGRVMPGKREEESFLCPEFTLINELPKKMPLSRIPTCPS